MSFTLQNWCYQDSWCTVWWNGLLWLSGRVEFPPSCCPLWNGAHKGSTGHCRFHHCQKKRSRWLWLWVHKSLFDCYLYYETHPGILTLTLTQHMKCMYVYNLNEKLHQWNKAWGISTVLYSWYGTIWVCPKTPHLSLRTTQQNIKW